MCLSVLFTVTLVLKCTIYITWFNFSPWMTTLLLRCRHRCPSNWHETVVDLALDLEPEFLEDTDFNVLFTIFSRSWCKIYFILAFLSNRIWPLSINLIIKSKLQMTFTPSGYSCILEITIFIATGITLSPQLSSTITAATQNSYIRSQGLLYQFTPYILLAIYYIY